MEISDVRRQVTETIERARRAAAERRSRNDEASREYADFLERLATPLLKQVAGVLKAQGYSFSVFTPGGAVRLKSDKTAEDFIEISLDTSGDRPSVVVHSSRTRGRRVMETERPLSEGPVREITEEQVLGVVLHELAPLVER
jgi:hypothetical protein